VSFHEIDGLGNKGDLAELCRACKDKGMCVIADVVFNHMAVVASRDEWMRAQRDKGYNEELLSRLDNYFKPLDRNDFNPWMDMMGEGTTTHHLSRNLSALRAPISPSFFTSLKAELGACTHYNRA